MLAREDRLFRRFRRSGDADALAEVFDRTAPELLRLARLLVGEGVAHDLVQATFVDAIENAKRYEETRRVRPWLCGLLANHARRHRRSAARESEAIHRAAARAAPGRSAAPADVLAADVEAADRLRRSIDALDEPYSTVLRLQLDDGLNATEIAARLARPAGTVRTQLVRAYDRLRRTLPASATGVAMLSARPASAELTEVRSRVLSRAHIVRTVPAATAAVSLLGITIMKKSLCMIAAIAVALASVFVFRDLGGGDAGSASRPDVPPIVAARAERVGSPAAADDSPSLVRTRAADAPVRDANAGTRLRVVDSDRAPVSGQIVSVRIEDRLIAHALTDVAGEVEFAALPDDAAVQAGSVCERVGDLPLVASSVREIVFLDGPRVAGHVVDTSGRPVAGAQVRVLRWAPTRPLPADPVARSDAMGAFAVTAPDAEQVVLEVMKDGFAPVATLLVPVGADDLVVRLGAEGRRLAGRVFDPQGEPVPYCRVDVMVRMLQSRRVGDAIHRQFETVLDADAEGAFEVAWLPAGSGMACATDAGRTVPLIPQEFGWVATATFDLGEVSRQVVTLRGSAPGEIHVEVLDASGRPVAGASLSARLAGDAVVMHPALRKTGSTDAEGRATLGPLAAGRFQVTATRGEMRASVVDVPVPSGASADCVLRFAQTSCPLEVVVVDPQGLPLRGWTVRLMNRTSLSTASTDREGCARFEGLLAGVMYRVQVLRDEVPLAGRDEVDPSRGVLRLTVDPANSAPAAVHGRVVADAPVHGHMLTSRVGGGPELEARIAEDGAFGFSRLPAGDYRLWLRSDTHVLASRTFTVPPGDDLDLGEVQVERGATLSLSIPGLTAPEADAIRVLFGPVAGSIPMTRDPATTDSWILERIQPVGSHLLTIFGPDTIPVVRDVELRSGPNRIDIERPAGGSPVRFEIRLLAKVAGPFADIANVNLQIRDAAGAAIVGERFFGHFDDPAARLLVRRFALPPGTYTVEVSSLRQSATATFELGSSAQPTVVGVTVE